MQNADRSAQIFAPRLLRPLYLLADASRYAEVTTQTIRNWHSPYADGGQPLGPREKGERLSYLQLVEVAFVASFRHAGVSLRKIRAARDYIGRQFNVAYPFATYQFLTDGQHVIMEFESAEPSVDKNTLLIASDEGQLAWKNVLLPRFEQFEYDGQLAARWHPRGTDQPIIIDPEIAFGSPIVEGVATGALAARYVAGETPDEIATDFKIHEDFVRRALQFEGVAV